jgi:hypothetical protein
MGQDDCNNSCSPVVPIKKEYYGSYFIVDGKQRWVLEQEDNRKRKKEKYF